MVGDEHAEQIFGKKIEVFPGGVSEWDKTKSKYNELLMAVESKFDGETRHETALRYIRERESRTCAPNSGLNGIHN